MTQGNLATMETIHKRIRRLRESKGLSQQALGALIVSPGKPKGVSYQTVQLWEREDGTAPTRKNMPLLARALGVSEQLLLHGDPRKAIIDSMAETAESKLLEQLIRLYGELKPEFQARVLAEANFLHAVQYPHSSTANPNGKKHPKRKGEKVIA